MATVAEQWVLVEMVQALYEVRPPPEPPESPRSRALKLTTSRTAVFLLSGSTRLAALAVLAS